MPPPTHRPTSLRARGFPEDTVSRSVLLVRPGHPGPWCVVFGTAYEHLFAHASRTVNALDSGTKGPPPVGSLSGVRVVPVVRCSAGRGVGAPRADRPRQAARARCAAARGRATALRRPHLPPRGVVDADRDRAL